MKCCLTLLLVLLAGCSSQPVSTTSYLLRAASPGASGELQPSSRYYFHRLLVADYIDQPGLVLETSPGEVHMARNHLWAEPLRRSLRTFLQTEVSARLGEDVLFLEGHQQGMAIDVTIDQLHGTHDGDAILVAAWQLGGGNEQPVRAYRFARSTALQADGYDGLVAAQKQLLSDLAQAIANSLSPVI